MTLPRTVADVLSRHVTFEIESIDRMYLNVYQPRLQYTGGAAAFFVGHRGFTYASSALMAQMTQVFVADLYHFIAAHDVPLVHFAKGQRKDDVTRGYLVFDVIDLEDGGDVAGAAGLGVKPPRPGGFGRGVGGRGVVVVVRVSRLGGRWFR
jgi:hypothetical protein